MAFQAGNFGHFADAVHEDEKDSEGNREAAKVRKKEKNLDYFGHSIDRNVLFSFYLNGWAIRRDNRTILFSAIFLTFCHINEIRRR